jgi:GT2 family glycosyltransferase
MKSSVSVVIPTFNGLELLKKNLPPLIGALKFSGAQWEIIIIEDAGTDGTVEFIREHYPDINLMRNESNKGFAETVNRGIFAAKYDVIMTLNNDVAVEMPVFASILPRFADPGIFAVSPNVLDPNNGRNQAVFKLNPGICWFTDIGLQEYPASKEIELFFASGGSSCYSREKICQLGGFDPVYKPFYVEDVDLSYRAWKRGWKSVLEPGAVVWHETNTTINKYHRRRNIKFITARNKMMFMWMNITDLRLILLYFLFFIPSVIWDILSFRKYKFIGTLMALGKLPEIVEGRKRRKKQIVLSDSDILKRVSYVK